MDSTQVVELTGKLCQENMWENPSVLAVKSLQSPNFGVIGRITSKRSASKLHGRGTTFVSSARRAEQKLFLKTCIRMFKRMQSGYRKSLTLLVSCVNACRVMTLALSSCSMAFTLML
ncbi:unnamed protein product [Symbiodinium natans]|uniref:Uncharacterized protein n=1 Tax=Symbiodinium natans TaxID=878477 RepID=A0A812S9L0_9DINO|nr:unnamed protein product [Symbiodinium natans]